MAQNIIRPDDLANFIISSDLMKLDDESREWNLKVLWNTFNAALNNSGKEINLDADQLKTNEVYFNKSNPGMLVLPVEGDRLKGSNLEKILKELFKKNDRNVIRLWLDSYTKQLTGRAISGTKIEPTDSKIKALKELIKKVDNKEIAEADLLKTLKKFIEDSEKNAKLYR